MAKTTNPEGNITYKFAGDENELTSEDKKKILKLAKKIEKGKDIAAKFKKPSYDIRKILTTKIVRECKSENKTEELTLLHHVILHGDEQAIKNILKEAKKAKKYQLLEQISNEPMITKYLGSQGKLIRTFSTVKYKNGVASAKTFETHIKTTVNVKHDGTSTTPAINNTGTTDTSTCENSPSATKGTADPVPPIENLSDIGATNEESEKDNTTTVHSTETADQEPNTSNDPSPTEIKPCSDSESGKGNPTDEEPINKSNSAKTGASGW